MTYQSHPTLYADGIGKISHENGVVKIDFVTLQDQYVNANTKPQRVPVIIETMILSPAGFQQTLRTMQDMALSLEKKGNASAKKPVKLSTAAAE